MNDGKKSRRRRSSSLIYQEPPESIEHMSDQSALPNVNANWVNAKGEPGSTLGFFEEDMRMMRIQGDCIRLSGRIRIAAILADLIYSSY